MTRVESLLPAAIARAVRHVRARMNAWIVLDAALAGGTAGIVAGGVLVTARWGGRVSLAWVVASGLIAALAIAVREARSRWADAFAAASMLDELLGAKDRFVSALHFVAAGHSTPIHRLQVEDATTYLDRVARTPSPPRPRFRSPRIAIVAIAIGTVCLGVTFARGALARLHLPQLFAGATHRDDSPQAIAARAAALREALRDSPSRRIDAEINALDRALHEQAARAEAERTRAIERAAEAIEQAHREETSAARSSASTEQNGPHSLQGVPDSAQTQVARAAFATAQQAREQASRREASIREELRRAQSMLAAAHGPDGNAEDARRWQQRRDELLAQLAQSRARSDDAARREREAQQALQQSQQRDAAAQAQASQTQRLQPQTTFDLTHSSVERTATLDDAVRRLDRALQSIQRSDATAPVPSETTGRALDRASAEIRDQLPETSRGLDDASRARSANDGQGMDDAIARARASLTREAHAESTDTRRAREALDRLQDQAANAAQQQQTAAGQTADDGMGSRQNGHSDGLGSASEAIDREQEALRNAQQGNPGDGHETSDDGEAGQDGSQGERGSDGSQTAEGQRGQPGRNGQSSQSAAMGQLGPGAQTGQGAEMGQSGRRVEGGTMGRSSQPGASAWAQGMTPASGTGGPLGPSMQGAVQSGRRGSDASAMNGAVGGEIGNDRGNSAGLGLSQGNRTVNFGQLGAQAVSHFDRGNGATEGGGRNQMSGDGPGQAHGATGSQGGRTPSGPNDQQAEGGHSWGSSRGGALTQAPPVATGPFGHDVDPGGHPREQAQLAPDAHGWMMPGVAQQGAANGPTMELPVAPGSLLPNAPGDGALSSALDEDPEQTMVTQRVPPSLRAYVRRYFQGIQNGAPAAPPRSP